MDYRAIILVAGMGTRLRPLTEKTHKCLTEVNGTTILHNALSQLRAVGVNDVTLVVGYLAQKVRAAVEEDNRGIRIVTVENARFAETNTSWSLRLGLERIGNYDSLLLLEGDVFFDGSLLRAVVEDPHSSITALERYNPMLDGTFVELDAEHFVRDWTHKTMREPGYTLDDKYKTINIHKLSRSFIDDVLRPALLRVSDETRGKAPLENVMREIVRGDGKSVYGLDCTGKKWVEIDDLNDLAIAQRIFEKRTDE